MIYHVPLKPIHALSYLCEIIRLFVSRLCYSMHISFSLRCFQVGVHCLHHLFATSVFASLFACRQLSLSSCVPDVSRYFMTSVLAPIANRILQVIFPPPPCDLVHRRFRSCSHAKHFLSWSQYHNVLIPPSLWTLLSPNTFSLSLRCPPVDLRCHLFWYSSPTALDLLPVQHQHAVLRRNTFPRWSHYSSLFLSVVVFHILGSLSDSHFLHSCQSLDGLFSRRWH